MKKCLLIGEVITNLKQAGCRGSFDPHSTQQHLTHIPTWAVYLLARQWRSELCAIAVCNHVMSQKPKLKPIIYKPERDNKCSFCTKFSTKHCGYGAYKKGIPPKVFLVGCAKWQENKSVYF